jgi:hypothetical protein
VFLGNTGIYPWCFSPEDQHGEVSAVLTTAEVHCRFQGEKMQVLNERPTFFGRKNNFQKFLSKKVC